MEQERDLGGELRQIFNKLLRVRQSKKVYNYYGRVKKKDQKLSKLLDNRPSKGGLSE